MRNLTVGIVDKPRSHFTLFNDRNDGAKPRPLGHEIASAVDRVDDDRKVSVFEL